jgi:hypothetical protein
MSANAQIALMLGIVGLEIIGIIGYLIFQSAWFKNLFTDKIERAWVYVWNGKGYKRVKGQLIDTTTGYTYRYKIFGANHEVRLKDDYPVEYENQRRMIYAQIGTKVPITLPGRRPIAYHETETAEHMAVESLKAAFMAIKKSGFQITTAMIIIAVIVIAAIGGGVYLYQKNQKPAVKPVGIPATTTPTKKILYQQDGWTVY